MTSHRTNECKDVAVVLDLHVKYLLYKCVAGCEKPDFTKILYNFSLNSCGNGLEAIKLCFKKCRCIIRPIQILFYNPNFVFSLLYCVQHVHIRADF